MNEPQSLSTLRKDCWSGIPSSPGVYWWYFPRSELERFRIAELCEVDSLRLRSAADGKVCLYHGRTNDLAERVEWHAAQQLTLKYLQSRRLSTLRFTLLALNDFDYLAGSTQIDRYFDTLSLSWKPTDSREAAKVIESSEFQGPYHYPLNIQENRHPELAKYVCFLKAARHDYKRRYTK